MHACICSKYVARRILLHTNYTYIHTCMHTYHGLMLSLNQRSVSSHKSCFIQTTHTYIHTILLNTNYTYIHACIPWPHALSQLAIRLVAQIVLHSNLSRNNEFQLFYGCLSGIVGLFAVKICVCMYVCMYVCIS
jgi:hypothetical protein